MPSFPIQINATQLVYRKLYLPNTPLSAGFDSRSIQTVQLDPGTYYFGVGAAIFAQFNFTVTPSGTIFYTPDCASFLDGLGSNQLVLKGLEVTLDARYLPGKGIIWSGDFADLNDEWFTWSRCKLLPAKGYSVQQAAAIVSTAKFNVDLNGHFSYDLGLDISENGPLQGARTSTLTFLGFPLVIDARDTNGSTLILDGIAHGTPPNLSKVEIFNLLPADSLPLKVDEKEAKFGLSTTGQIEPQGEDFLGTLRVDTFHGLQRLTVTGFAQTNT